MHRTGTWMDNHKWSLEFFGKKEGWKGCEQELINDTGKHTERMEEKEEAGYRSPTWTLLQALQQINDATRIEGETIMSAPGVLDGCINWQTKRLRLSRCSHSWRWIQPTRRENGSRIHQSKKKESTRAKENRARRGRL